MSMHTVPLDEEHFRAAEDKARALGKTTEQYLAALIDADGQSFDMILELVRKGFEKMDEAEVDELLKRANMAARHKK